jgi:transcriptional regulator with XRE-family HTH domain
MLGNNLREFRMAASLSVTELARQVGCHKSTISKIEHCRIIPSAMMMDRIADALGKPVARIFFQPGDKSIYKREA